MSGRGRAALALCIGVVGGGAGCGDDRPDPEPITARSGSRLAVQWYRYTDGAVQAGPELYDLVEHTACAPLAWRGGAMRCVPIADQALFVDAACHDVVGRQSSINKPTHFLAYNRIAGTRVAIRVYRAGAPIGAPSTIYNLVDGACVGPVPAPEGAVYRATLGEVDGDSLVAFSEREVGDSRLGLTMRVGDDGVQIPLGLRDRELYVACVPTVDADDRTVCVPTTTVPAAAFLDPLCQRPAVVVPGGAEVPPAVALDDADGCTGYHVVGDERSAPVYVRDEFGGCEPSSVSSSARVFAVGGPAALPELARTIDAVPGRRLQRMVLTSADLRVVDDRLYDTATRAACQRRRDADGVIRCVPDPLPAATMAWTTIFCRDEAPVVQLPTKMCRRPAFATLLRGDAITIHAIGERELGPVFLDFDGACFQQFDNGSTELRRLGPALAADTFVGGIAFGER